MTNTKGNAHATQALVAMCAMSIVWIGIGWDCLTLYASPVIKEWGINTTAYMLTVTLVSMGNTIVSLFFYGQIEARLGIRKLLLIGGLLSTLAFVVYALSTNVVMLYIAGILFGLGVALVSNNTFATAINHWFKKRQGTFISVAATCGSVSGIIFAMVMAALIGAVGWRMSFWITAIISLVATVLVVALYKGEPEKLGEQPKYADETVQASDDGGAQEAAAEDDGVSYKDMFKTPQFWILVVEELLLGIISYAVMGNLPLIVTAAGFESLAGTVLSVTLAASAIFMMVGGFLCDKLGSKGMIVVCLVAFIIACVILRISGIALALIYVAAALVGICYDITQVPVAITVTEAFGSKEYAKKLGTVAGFLYLGVSLGPIVMSLFYDLGGKTYGLGLIFSIVLAVIACVLIFPGTRRAKVKTKTDE